ncbi:kinase-like domain-containing protein [Collybia nuda]|uniref:Kinase-like domain-containing protein n=1 Tax=Collybia nuda TaxID=64659 RepID=A0A9P6CM49_9AGAR|nr:kinase-like domain-containing protein [Collybia nuda]
MSDFELLEPTPHLCRKRDTGRIFVLKSFNSRDLRNSSEQTILGMLRTLDAPFLPRVYWSFRDNDIYRMVMEYYPRHNLSGQLARYGVLSSAHALFYACEIAEAVSALHATGIVHRNINPESVLIDSEGHVILSGLDHARIVEPSGKVQGVIEVAPETKGYQAPEVLLGWAHDFTVDCWGYGLLLHFMLSSLNPFQLGGEDRTSLERKIIHDPIDLHAALQPPARDLIVKCLERNPAIRLNINAMGKHPYFVNV